MSFNHIKVYSVSFNFLFFFFWEHSSMFQTILWICCSQSGVSARCLYTCLRAVIVHCSVTASAQRIFISQKDRERNNQKHGYQISCTSTVDAFELGRTDIHFYPTLFHFNFYELQWNFRLIASQTEMVYIRFHFRVCNWCARCPFYLLVN